MTALAADEFSPETTYLNTAKYGLPPARALAAVRAATAHWAAGRGTPGDHDDLVPTVRAAFARLLPGSNSDDIAIGNSVGALIGPIAASLPAGSQVLVVADDFASVSLPFHCREDLAVHAVPQDRLLSEIRPETALVAVSAVQSVDGRIADLAALRAATKAHDALLLVDSTQAAGWLPLRFADADFWVCASYKWLLGARSVAFFAAGPDAANRIHPVGPTWYSAAEPGASMYAPGKLAATTRRFDTTPDWLGIIATAAGLELIEEISMETIAAHNLMLADQFRTGLRLAEIAEISSRSAIVSVPGAGDAAERLAEAGVIASARNGSLRFSFHLHNSITDVDRALDILADTHPTP